MPRPVSVARLERELDARSWSILDLERASGVHRTVIHGIKSGRHVPTARTVRKLAEAFAKNPPLAVKLTDEAAS